MHTENLIASTRIECLPVNRDTPAVLCILMTMTVNLVMGVLQGSTPIILLLMKSVLLLFVTSTLVF